LQRHIEKLGRNNTYGLSLAFFNATCASRSVRQLWDHPGRRPALPRLCCNILNGGRHAYTNPVLSDFPEFLLVARSNRLEEVIEGHNAMQQLVREKLNRQATEVVSGNRVHRFRTADNRECIEFLLKIREVAGLDDKFEVMVDASAGDLWSDKEKGYRLSLTNKAVYSSEKLAEYWRQWIQDYEVRFLEDPFREQDEFGWELLSFSSSESCILGDNFYCSNAERISRGASKGLTNGVVIKPNQAGTVTAVCRAIEAARNNGQVVMTSHRSISTEETFLATLSYAYGAEYMKIGPLLTDYSSVLRFNAIMRLASATPDVNDHQPEHHSPRSHGVQHAAPVCRTA
jgi:enolase